MGLVCVFDPDSPGKITRENEHASMAIFRMDCQTAQQRNMNDCAPRTDPPRSDRELPFASLVAHEQRILYKRQNLPSPSSDNILRSCVQMDRRCGLRGVGHHDWYMTFEPHSEPHQQVFLDIRNVGREEQVESACGTAGFHGQQ